VAIDLTSLSPKQLQKLIGDAKREKLRQQKRAPIDKVRSKLTRMAAAEGYSLMELFGVKSGAKPATGKAPSSAKRAAARHPSKGSKVAPKYRNPANAAETWSGRGKHPRWMATLIAGGKKAEDFLI
jgi:DNA-binding protein H-NS